MDNNWLTIEEKDGEIILTQCSKDAKGDIKIPEELGITKIGDEAFLNCRNITSLTIPYGVTAIGNHLFAKWIKCFISLHSIAIPNTVTTIGDKAFSYCKLTSLFIPSSILSIGKGAFESQNLDSIVVDKNNPVYDSRNDCNAIIETATDTLLLGCSKSTIPDSITSIAVNAFCGCKDLASIDIPNSVTSIDDSAFIGCCRSNIILGDVTPPGLTSAHINCPSIGKWMQKLTDLEELVIGENVINIEEEAFDNCPNLTSIIVAPDNPKYDSKNNCNAIIESETNTLIAGCSSSTIPNSVTSIGDRAFYGCKELTSIVIPINISSIGDAAFHNSGLAFAHIKCPSIGKWMQNLTNLKELAIGENVQRIEDEALVGCKNLISIHINCQTIGRWLRRPRCWNDRENFPRIKEIEIGENVVNIEENAFKDCSDVTSVHLNCKTIGTWFQHLNKIEKLSIGENITNIENDAFNIFPNLTHIIVNPNNPKFDSRNNCNAIIENETNTLLLGSSSSTIPNSVTSIGDEAFYGCESLTSIDIPNGVTSIGKEAFCGCKGLTSIVIPNSVTSIGDGALAFCENLTSIDIPQNTTSIGTHLFAGCLELKSISVSPDNPKYDSRDNCNALIETETNTLIAGCSATEIPTSVKIIGKGAFNGFENLTSIKIPNNVTTIDDWAFEGCTKLSSITIPDGVTSIGDGAFYGCKKMTSIDIPNGVTSIGQKAFKKCSSITSIIIPDSVTSIGDWAFSYCPNLESIVIPDSVMTIGREAFRGCKKLTSVTIPSNAIVDVSSFDTQCTVTIRPCMTTPLQE